MDINYSFIIPHKNIPHLLQKCLDSIPHNPDVQIIVVDDNSDSSIVDFKNFPGYEDRNTKIIFTKEGRGAGYARNVGLQHAIGKWIVFADADDIFTSSINDSMKAYTNDIDHDLIIFDVAGGSYHEGKKEPDSVSIYNKCFNNLIHGISEELFFRITVVWGKFIKRDLIEQFHIRCDEVSCCDDTMFSLQVACHSSHYKADNAVIYKYYYREGSSWNDLENLQRLTDRVDVIYHSNQYLLKQGIRPYDLEDLGRAWMTLYAKSRFKALYRLHKLFSIGGQLTLKYVKKSISYHPTFLSRSVSNLKKLLQNDETFNHNNKL